MIKSVRPLFSLLLLIAIGTALSCRAAVRRRSFNLSMPEEAPLSVVVESQEAVVFNTTLLKLAAIDLGEEKSREEIHQLLQGDFLNKAPYRTISSWRRYHNRLGNDNVERRARSSFSSSKLPIQLRSPKYNGLWPQFRRSLRNWFRNKRFQPQIMSQLIHLIKIPIDQHQGFLPTSPPTKYASCAVVGNSGILLKGEHGALIDSHEMVIRLNNARTRGFEHQVGSKTGISFVNSNILHLCSHRESCFCHPYGETVPIVMYVCQPVHFMDYALCNASHKAPLLITDARFDVLCTRLVKYYSLKHFLEETGKSPHEWAPAHDGAMFHYSSGMQAVMLALGLCERVSVFGFGKSSMTKHHYHTNQKAELHLHDYEAEYVFYHDLVEKPQWFGFCFSGGLDSATPISGGSRLRLPGFYVSFGLSQFPVVTFLSDISVSGDSSSLPNFYFWDSTSGFYVSFGLSQLPVVTFLLDISIFGGSRFFTFEFALDSLLFVYGFSLDLLWISGLSVFGSVFGFALDFWVLSLLPCLIYLTVTRSDIVFAVGIVSQFMHAPRQPHWEAVCRILRYLKAAPGRVLVYRSSGHL